MTTDLIDAKFRLGTMTYSMFTFKESDVPINGQSCYEDNKLWPNLLDSDMTGCKEATLNCLRITWILATKFFTIPRRDTWDHSLVSLTYLVDEHSALPAPIAWKYLISNFLPSAAELFRLPPHRSGTHYQTQSFRH